MAEGLLIAAESLFQSLVGIAGHPLVGPDPAGQAPQHAAEQGVHHGGGAGIVAAGVAVLAVRAEGDQPEAITVGFSSSTGKVALPGM